MNDLLNIDQARQHVALIAGSADTPCTFQVFDDSPAKDPTKARFFHGTLADCWDRLVKASNNVCGVFITVNEPDGRGRKAENITRVRALFIDGDGIDMPAFKLAPTFTSARGAKNWHAYWIISDGDRATFKDDQTRLIDCYDSDKSIKDLPRVMRLAGFPHQKDPANISTYSITMGSGKTYTRQEVLYAHTAPKQDPEDLFSEEPPKEHSEEPAKELNDNEKRIVWEYIRKFESIQTQRGNDGLMKVCRALITGFGLDRGIAWKALDRWNREIAKPSWPMNALARAMATVERTRSKIPVGCLWENIDTEIPSEDDAKPGVGVCDLLELPADDPDALLGEYRWMCRGGLFLLSGQSGIGKSSLIAQLVVGWSCGVSVLGIRPKAPLRVLVIQAENDPGDLREQLLGVIDGMGLRDRINEIHQRVRFITDAQTSGPALAVKLREYLDAFPADLIIIDPLFSFLGGDANEQAVVSNFLRGHLLPLAQDRRCAIGLVHHTIKPSRDGKDRSGGAYRGAGSAELENVPRATLALLAGSQPDTATLYAAKRGSRLRWKDSDGNPTCEKRLRQSPERICWVEDGSPAPERGEEKEGGDDDRIGHALVRAAGPMTKVALSKAAGVSRTAVTRAADRMRAKGWMHHGRFELTTEGRNHYEDAFSDDQRDPENDGPELGPETPPWTSPWTNGPETPGPPDREEKTNGPTGPDPGPESFGPSGPPPLRGGPGPDRTRTGRTEEPENVNDLLMAAVADEETTDLQIHMGVIQ